MQTVIIDERFKNILPPLGAETLKLLEENIIENGCRDSLVLWNGVILIDGYNRYDICTRHDIPFNTVDKEFDSREEALIWIITNQVSRRNLTPTQLSNYRGMHYKADRMIVTNASGKNQFNGGEEVGCQNGNQPKRQKTGALLSDIYNVSPRTISRDVKLAEGIEAIGGFSPDAELMILHSKVKIEKRVLEELSSKPKEEIEALAMAIENGTYTKEKPPSQQAEPAVGGDPTGDSGAQETPGAPPVNEEAPESSHPALNPVDSIFACILPLDAVIESISDSFSVLPAVTKKVDRTRLKTALRTRLDSLEGLYSLL